jgi:hypothetical protein
LEALRTDVASPERDATRDQDDDWRRNSFCVKLPLSLNHTKEHPEDGGWVGTMWSPDRETFFVRSRIFGQPLTPMRNYISLFMNCYGRNVH